MAKKLTVHDFEHEAVHEFLHLDGKIGRSLKLLVSRPGETAIGVLYVLLIGGAMAALMMYTLYGR